MWPTIVTRGWLLASSSSGKEVSDWSSGVVSKAASSSAIATRGPNPHLIPLIPTSDIVSQLRASGWRRMERMIDSLRVKRSNNIGLLVVRYH